MPDIRIDEALWSTSMAPEGIVERWLVDEGSPVLAGERVAEVRIEDALHEILAPADGCICILARANSVVEPGSLVAQLTASPPPGRRSPVPQ